MASRPSPPRRPTDLVTAAMSRSLRLGSRRYAITIDRAVPVPMRDGTILLADHYAPVTAEPRPAVLMRCPYGRGPQFAVSAWPLAEHVPGTGSGCRSPAALIRDTPEISVPTRIRCSAPAPRR
jgi:hypothetical protein